MNKGPISIEAGALGSAIRVRRKRARLTQRALADRAGLDVTDLSRFETGKREPHPSQLRAIARALRVAPSRLVRAWGAAGRRVATTRTAARVVRDDQHPQG